MTMFQDIDAEVLARIFDHYQDAVAVDSERSRIESSSSWRNAREKKRKLLADAARLTLLELSSSSAPAESASTEPTSTKPVREFFAKPGEAEWGC